jgi:DNA-binding GntR family transcriptional regulator
VAPLDALRTAIYHGELTPGQRLVEADLAERFRTSRSTVREALTLLTNEGLVTRERHRGASVRPLSLADAVEITEARRALEGICAAKAAVAMTVRERTELRGIADEMTAAVRVDDIAGYNRASRQVHDRIREIAGQTTVTQVLDRLRYRGVRFQFHVAVLPGRLAAGLCEHVAVVDAVCSGHPDLAEQAMRDHLSCVIEALYRFRDLHPVATLPVRGARTSMP